MLLTIAVLILST